MFSPFFASKRRDKEDVELQEWCGKRLLGLAWNGLRMVLLGFRIDKIGNQKIVA